MKLLWRSGFGGVIMGILLALGCSQATIGFAQAVRDPLVAVSAHFQPAALAATPGWAVQIQAGYAATCALTTTGQVQCWGGNWGGNLGDGTTRNRAAPVTVVGLSEPVVQLTVGDTGTCVVTASGGAQCWGDNYAGQLGDGTTVDRWTPVTVTGLSRGVQALSAGDGHTCALLTSGGVQCWGENSAGQLGDGTNVTRLTPVAVVGLASGVVAISAGAQHTCAVTQAGAVQCWGSNHYGQLGDGTQVDRWQPTAVLGLPAAVQSVSAGDAHTCVVTDAGGAQCWGGNVGLLGDGTVDDRLTPVAVVGLSTGVQTISAARYHTCALTVSGGVKCWGGNKYGQLGNGVKDWYSLTPVDVLGLTSGATAVDVGNSLGHSCAVTVAGDVKCWGANWAGQLGDGTLVDRPTPVTVWRPDAYDCAAVTEIPPPECQALMTFFMATNGPLWQDRAGWLRTPTPCSWQGVTCADGHVSALVLPANHLVDTLPAALADLPALRRLDLHGNDLSGPLPAAVGDLSALQYLDLSESGLADVTLPPEWGNLAALQTLDLHGNALAGPLPASLSQLGALRTLDLSHNAITGTLPAALADLAQLRTLNLSENQFSGPLLAGLADLTQLRTLDLSANQLSGPLPANLGRWVTLQTLDLSHNAFSGPLPESLGDAAALRTLDLSANQLSGPLPWQWSRLTALAHLDLGHNALSGELPPEWGLLPALQYLDLSYNTLEGWLPSGYSQWAALTYLDLSFNALRGPLPAAWGAWSHLQTLSLNNNHLAGAIPAAWGTLGSAGLLAQRGRVATPEAEPVAPATWEPPVGVYLDLSCNRLSGTIPPELSGIPALQGLGVSSNQLRSPIPAGLRGAIPYFFPEFNLLTEYPHDGTQTVPPSNLEATLSAPDRVRVSWTPIEFFGGEVYEISYATSPAGPFTVAAQLSDDYNFEPRVEIGGLTPEQPYYFRIRVFTSAQETEGPSFGPIFDHYYYQQSNLWSDYTPLVSVNVAATPTPTATVTPTTTPTPTGSPSPPRLFLPLLWR